MAKKSKGKFVKGTEKIGFYSWNLPAMEEGEAFLARIVKEALAIATTEYECEAYFPIEWNFGKVKERNDGMWGPPVDDPMVVYVSLPLGPTEEDSPTWKFSLDAMVEDFIGGAEEGGGGPIGAAHREIASRLEGAFRQLADKIGAALARPS